MNKSKVLRRATDGRYVWKRNGKYKYKNGRLLINYHSPIPSPPLSYNVPDSCSRGNVDTTDSDESYILEDNVNKLLNPSEYKFRPINFFNNVEQNPQKLRKSIITRALQNVISSTPMPSKHTRNFINTDISLDLSPIDGNYEQVQNCHEIQEDKTLTNNTNKLKSQSIVFTISDSENNENDYPQNSHPRMNRSKRFDPENTEEPADMKPLSSSRNNYNKKENSRSGGNTSQRKTGKPQKSSNSSTQSVLWKKKSRSSDLTHDNKSKLNNSEDVDVENQMKTNSKLDLYCDNKLNSDAKKNTSVVKSDIENSDSSKLSAKKLSFASACTEWEKQDSKELSAQVTLCNSRLISGETTMKKSTEPNVQTKKNQNKKAPPKPAPRKMIATIQKRACNSKLQVCEDKIVTEITTPPCNFIAEQNEVLYDSVDKQIDNFVVTKSRLNGTRISLLSGGDIHKDKIVKTMIDIATSPCSFGKKPLTGSPKDPGSTKQCDELVAKTMTSIATSPHKFDKALETNSLETSQNRLKNVNISKYDAIQENVTNPSKIINNSKLCDSGGKTKSFVDIGTTPCSLKQEKMKRLLQLVQNLSKAKNKEVSSHSVIEDNKNMTSKEIQTSTEAISSKENPFKNFGRNISTQTVTEQYGRSSKLQEVDNKSDCTNESHLLREIEDDILFRTAPPESHFTFSDEDDYMLEDSNKNCPWRLSGDFIPLGEPKMDIKFNFLRSAQKIQEEKESLINNDRRFSINLSNNQKLSVKKGRGSHKKKSNKCRQYSRRPSRRCSAKNRRSGVGSSISSTFSRELHKWKSVTNSEKSSNCSNVLFTNELPHSEASEQFRGVSSNIIGKNPTRLSSEKIESSTNRSSILNNELSSKLSVDSGQESSKNQHNCDHDLNAQPLRYIEPAPELLVKIARISVMGNKNLEQSKGNILSPELNDKSTSRSSVRKNMSLQLLDKNKTQENKEHPSKHQSVNRLEADTSSSDKLIRKSQNDNTSVSVSPHPVSEIPSNRNEDDFRNFEDLAMPLNESFKETPRISKKVNNINCNMVQEELLKKCNEEERGSKSNLKNTSKSCGVSLNQHNADTTSNLDRDGSTDYDLLEKREVPVFKVPKKRAIKPKLRNTSESCGVSSNAGHADTTTDRPIDILARSELARFQLKLA